MYVTTANECHALDAGNGRRIWDYRRPRTKGLAGDAASGINRGVAVAGDRVFMVTDNAHILALDRFTGALLWDTEMADWRQNYGATSAPLAVGGLVISGTSGGDEGVRGFLAAFDQATGKEAWRFWTVPKRGEPGSETWQGTDIDHPCATAWLTGTYDAELDTLYWPTGNPCPDYDGAQRVGDNLYSDSILALDAEDGPAEVALPVHAARRLGLGRPAAAGARRRRLAGQAAQAPAAREPQRLLLRARPHERRAAPGQAVRQEADLGARDRPRRPSRARSRTRRRPPRAERSARRSKARPTGSPPRSTRPPASTTCRPSRSARVYTQDAGEWQAGKSYYGGTTKDPPEDRPRRSCARSTSRRAPSPGSCRRPAGPQSWGGALATASGLVFFGEDGGALMAVDAVDRPPALALPGQCALERLAHDLHVRRQAIHRGGGGPTSSRSRWWSSTGTNSPIPFISPRADNPPGMEGEPCRGRRPCSSC